MPGLKDLALQAADGALAEGIKNAILCCEVHEASIAAINDVFG